MPSYFPKSLLDESHADDMRAATSSMVAKQQQEAEQRQQEQASQPVDFGSLVKSLTSTWTDPTTTDTSATTSATGVAPAQQQQNGSGFDLHGLIHSLTSTWRDPSQQDTSSVEPGSTPPGSAVSSAPAGASPPSAGAQPAPMPTGQSTGPAPAPQGDLQSYARQVAQRYGVDPDVFVRQINQESGFNPRAVSPAGAQGIAQFMPDTARGVGLGDPFEPYSALDAAAKHMRQNLDANHGDYRFALAAYNAGQGNVDRYGEGVFGSDFANGQTRDYVNIILGPNGQPKAATAPSAPASPPSQPSAASNPAPISYDDMVTVRMPDGKTTMQVPRGMVGEGPGKYAPSKGWQIVSDAAPVAPSTPQGGPPWESQQSASGAMSPGSTPMSAAPTSGSSPDLMLRQPLNQQTSGPDTVSSAPQDAQTGTMSSDPASLSQNDTATTALSPTDAPAGEAGVSAGPGSSYPGAGASQDDQTQSGYVQPDMAPGPPATQPIPQPAESPLKPVYDMLGNIQGYVHTGLDATESALNAARLPDVVAPVRSAANAAAPVLGSMFHGTAGQSILDATDSGNADVKSMLERQQAIWQQAEDWQNQYGRPGRPGVVAVTDPAWRQANPDLASEWDEINDKFNVAAGQASQAMEVAKAAEPALQVARPAITRGIEAVRSGLTRAGEALGENAGRVAVLDAERAGQGSTVAASAFGSAPEIAPASDTSRFYHGTASDFERANADKFDPNGLYGPGYYTTSDARVAGDYSTTAQSGTRGRTPEDLAALREELHRAQTAGDYDAVDELQHDVTRLEQAFSGGNVRPLDVPNDLTLFDADRPFSEQDVNVVSNWLDKNAGSHIAAAFDENVAAKPTGADIYQALTRAYEGDKQAVNDVLARVGFDGVAHEGGHIRPIMDATGAPINHEVRVIFPDALPRIRQAYSGEYGGVALGTTPQFPGAEPATGRLGAVNRALGQGLASATSGGVGAAVNQQINPDDPNAAWKGFAVGAVAPYAIARGAGALAGRAGREIPQAEGALASLGSAPGPRRYTNPADALAASHEAIGVPEPVSPNAGVSRIEAVRRFIVRQATDNKVDLAKLQQDAQRTLGRPLTGEEMLTEQARVNPAGAGKIMLDEKVKPVLQALDDERPVVTLPNGKPLTQRTALTQAMVLANNRDVSVALNAPARAFSGGLTGADSEAALQHLISNMAPEDQRAVATGMRDLNGVVETYRQKLVDAGVWSKDFADEMRDKYPNWIPTKILDYMADADKGSGIGAKSISMRDRGIRQYTLDGTTKSREDPIASLIRYVDESESRIQKNEVFNGFANLFDALKANPDSGWANQVKEVPNSATAASGLGERTVQGFQNGERRTFITSPSVSAAVRMEQGAQIPLIRNVTSLFRELITRTPVFVAGQIPLDFMAGVARTANLEGGPQHAPKVAAEIVKGYAEAFRGLLSNEFKGDAARYMKEGGAMAGFYERGLNAAHHTVDSLTRRSMFEIKDAGDAANLAKWLAGGGWVQAVGQRVELAPRIAAFRMGEQRALKAGADAPTAALQGVMAGRNSTMDFQVGGAASKVINQVVPFFNVGVQSSVTLARMARENPKAFPLTMMGLVAAPQMAAEAWNRSDPQRAKDYADVPEYIKDRGIVMMLPGVSGTDEQGNKKPNYALIPLRELAPVAIMSRELAANAMRAAGYEGEDEPRGWAALLGAAASASSPVQANSAADLFSSMNPVGINTGLQLATNRDYFRNRDIATERNDQNASSLARGAAGALNAVTGSQVRPSQADFAIRDLAGGVGAAASAASDMVTGRTKDEDRIQNAPVVGGLVKRFVGDSTGGQLEKARDNRISEQARSTASAFGLRDDQLTPVGTTIDNIPLMQAEQTSYQMRTNRYFDQELAKTRAGAAWQQRPQERRQFILDALSAAKERAAAEIMRNIPPNERQRRIGQAARQKAS